MVIETQGRTGNQYHLREILGGERPRAQLARKAKLLSRCELRTGIGFLQRAEGVCDYSSFWLTFPNARLNLLLPFYLKAPPQIEAGRIISGVAMRRLTTRMDVMPFLPVVFGLGELEAAAAIGIFASKFRVLVSQKRMPSPQSPGWS